MHIVWNMELEDFTKVSAMLKMVRDYGIKKMRDFEDNDCFAKGDEFYGRGWMDGSLVWEVVTI